VRAAGIPPVDLGDLETLSVTVVPLDEPVIGGGGRQAELSRDDRGGVVGTRERAGDHRIPAPSGQQLACALRLLAPGVVERDVGSALDAALEIPVRLAVAHEVEQQGGSSRG
jgi:hypothetical protein